MKFVLDTHMHTIASGHAYSTVKEYVDEAKVKGLALIAITDHAPDMPGSMGILHFYNLNAIKSLNAGVEVLTGVELNILDKEGRVDLSDSMLKTLDVIIASLHPTSYPFADRESNTLAVLNAMKNPYIRIIGHLGDPRYPFDCKRVVDMAIETNTFLEINNASFKERSLRNGGEETVLELIERCKEKNHPVIVGSDAHIWTELGTFENAIRILEKAGMPEHLILNTSVELFLRHMK